MVNCEELKNLWQQHEQRRFPLGIRGKKFNDVDLTQTESQIGRYILATIELHGKPLSQRMLSILLEQVELLDKAFPSLPSDAKDYFEELKRIATFILG